MNVNEVLDTRLGDFFRASGVPVIEVDGIPWYKYSGFVVPAFLPHCTPAISSRSAAMARKRAGVPFARWVSAYGEIADGEWWYVIRRGTYDRADCSSNTRSKINRGRKKLHARRLTADEVADQGYDLCQKASERFDAGKEFLPSREEFIQRTLAVKKVPGALEYCGVFFDDRLVGLSENLVQQNATFWETIWYDPEFMRLYSSYVLTDFMLDHYLNERDFDYVSDGSRSIYHKTAVQEFFMEKFKFERIFGDLNINYNLSLKAALVLASFFRVPLLFAARKYNWQPLNRVCALLVQDSIICSNRQTR